VGSDYSKVQDALASGAEPRMLCATCPWDRFCIEPPSMTRADIDRHIEEATKRDEETAAKARAEGKQPGMPVGVLVTAMTFSGRDTAASVCPVFALRLRSSGGRRIVDALRSEMTTWDDEVTA